MNASDLRNEMRSLFKPGTIYDEKNPDFIPEHYDEYWHEPHNVIHRAVDGYSHILLVQDKGKDEDEMCRKALKKVKKMKKKLERRHGDIYIFWRKAPFYHTEKEFDSDRQFYSIRARFSLGWYSDKEKDKK